MNRSIAIVCLALVTASGCSPNPGPIKVLNFYPPNGPELLQCSAPKTASTFIYQGSLDVAGGAQYYLGAIVQNILSGSAGQSGDLTASNGTILEASNRDSPIIDSVVMSYSSKPRLSGFKDYSVPVHLLFDSTGFINMGAFNIIGPDAAAALDALQPSNDPADGVDLYVSVEFNGFMQRQGNRISSGPNVFPIKVRRSMATCTTSFRRGFNCTYPGQEANALDYCCACGAFGSAACASTEGCF